MFCIRGKSFDLFLEGFGIDQHPDNISLIGYSNKKPTAPGLKKKVLAVMTTARLKDSLNSIVLDSWGCEGVGRNYFSILKIFHN